MYLSYTGHNFQITISKEQVLFILASSNRDMKKAILLSVSLLILAVSMNSCKKCYKCVLSKEQVVNSKDTVITLQNELCNKGSQGAGANLSIAIKDIEANGYICTPE